MARHVRIAGLVLVAFVLCALVLPAGAQDDARNEEREQMRGLDEQIQEIKSEVLDIAQELSRLEEKLLYPSGTQVAVFVALADGEPMRLDAVQLSVDGKLVAHHIYSAGELEALRKGGVQRLHVGNVATGEHAIEVRIDARLPDGSDFTHTDRFVVTKGVEPALVALTVAGPASGRAPIALEEW